MNTTYFFSSLLDILNEMSPYVLLGFLIAGMLHEFVKPETMSRHLAGRGWKPVVKAALLGVPLPLCSCGVLPTAVGLHRQGASKGATTSFLIATPQTGVDSIAATYSLLGLPMAILRPVAALVGGFVGGMSVNFFDWEKTSGNKDMVENGKNAGTVSGFQSCDSCCHTEVKGDKAPLPSRFWAAVKYGMVDMVASVGKWLVIGLIVAALITAYVPDRFLLSLSDRPLLAMLAMIAIAVPMYVCATGSIPIAMSLMVKGLNPGAAFVLLMAGPAANFASMIVLGRAIGKRATAIYILSVIITALFFGLVVDYLFPAGWSLTANGAAPHACHESFGWFETSCTIFLVAALVYSFMAHRHHHDDPHSTTSNMTTTFKIEGMACNHCRMTVEKAISAVPGVEKVVVDLSAASAIVKGNFDSTAIVKAITDSGFDVKGQNPHPHSDRNIP